MKKSYTYAMISILAWATLAAVTKKILFNIPNMQALAISSYVASGFLLLVNIKKGSIKKMKTYSFKNYSMIAGLGFIGMFMYSALYYYGLTKLSSQEACIVNYLWPIMLVIFSCIILKEKLTILKVFAMLCSFLGIVTLSLGGNETKDESAIIGIICCAVAAACYGLFSVLNKKINFDQNISMMIFWLVTGVCATIAGVMTEKWTAIDSGAWIGMLWLGIMVNAIAYLFWALALQGCENTARIANLAFLTPFLSLVVSTVLLKEQIQLRAVVALVLIVGGILIQSICEKDR